jgi:sporulation protein YlmC with PRC-barrel domain
MALHRATRLVGAPVENLRGESLGKIEDLIIDPGDGRVAAAIVSMGGFLGIGEKLTAIPMPALSYEESMARFVLDIDRETLRRAPAFDPQDWPELLDRIWAADVHTIFGYPPYWH